jgi:phage gp36-like protein
MSYLTQDSLGSIVPPAFIIQALDDDADGLADDGLWDSIAAEAAEAVDAFLAGRYAVPFSDPAPAVVAQAAKVFAAEMLYTRRGFTGQQNPFTVRADSARARLEKIGSGELPLDASAPATKPPVSIVSAEALTVPNSKLNS